MVLRKQGKYLLYSIKNTHTHQLSLAAQELQPSAHHTQAVNVCCFNSKTLDLEFLQSYREHSEEIKLTVQKMFKYALHI